MVCQLEIGKGVNDARGGLPVGVDPDHGARALEARANYVRDLALDQPRIQDAPDRHPRQRFFHPSHAVSLELSIISTKDVNEPPIVTAASILKASGFPQYMHQAPGSIVRDAV